MKASEYNNPNFFVQIWKSILYALNYIYFVSCGTAVAIVDLWVLGTYSSRHRYVGSPSNNVSATPATSTCVVTFHPKSTRRSRFAYADAIFVVHRNLISRRLLASVGQGQRPVALVTGCSVGGIGWSAAVHLLISGFDVVMLCREGKKAADAMNAARTAVGAHYQQDYTLAARSGAGSMRVVTADVGDVEAMAALGSSLVATEPNLRVVVANAGYMACPAGLTPTGLELQMGTHVAGHGALLLSLVEEWRGVLLDRTPQRHQQQQQRRDTPLRIVVVSSAAAVGGVIPPVLQQYHSVQDLSTSYDRFQAYRDAKLSEAALAIALSRRIQRDAILRTSVTVNTLHPGPIWSHVVPNSQLQLPWLMDWSVSSHIFRMSPHASGLFVADLCLHEDFDAVTGHYFRMGVDMTAHYADVGVVGAGSSHGDGTPRNWNTVWSPGLPSPIEASHATKGEALLRSVEGLMKRSSKAVRR